MEQWNKLEEKYSKMKDRTSPRAKSFRQKMIDDYKSMVAKLSDATEKDRQHLVDVHEKRILVDFSERYKEALDSFKDLLGENPDRSRLHESAKVWVRFLTKMEI